MNQKEMMLQGSAVKVKTHTITVGHSAGLDGNSDSYGFVASDPILGDITPQTFLQTKIISVYSYYGNGACSTEVILNAVVQDVDTIRITRLDTAESIMVSFKGEGSYWYTTSEGGIFSSADVGKTIDLIIEPV